MRSLLHVQVAGAGVENLTIVSRLSSGCKVLGREFRHDRACSRNQSLSTISLSRLQVDCAFVASLTRYAWWSIVQAAMRWTGRVC
jgi:hypothetical protein